MKSVKYNLLLLDRRDYNLQHAFKAIRNYPGTSKLEGIITPPIPSILESDLVSNSCKDICQVIITPRYEGNQIYPILNEDPSYVNILVPQEGCSWKDGPYIHIDIGVISSKDMS